MEVEHRVVEALLYGIGKYIKFQMKNSYQFGRIYGFCSIFLEKSFLEKLFLEKLFVEKLFFGKTLFGKNIFGLKFLVKIY